MTTRTPCTRHRPGLTWKSLQEVRRVLGDVVLACDLCGHRFPAEAETTKHDCKVLLFGHPLVQIEPLSPSIPMELSSVFYTDFHYGKD